MLKVVKRALINNNAFEIDAFAVYPIPTIMVAANLRVLNGITE